MRLPILIACLLLPTIVSGQPASSGVVDGWIVDATGSPLPGVGVSVWDGGTEVAKTITPTSGRFQLELPAGFYAITAGLPGFMVVKRSIQIEPKQTVVVPILLRLGHFGDLRPRPTAGTVGRNLRLDCRATPAPVPAPSP
jgi:hypothetical protein